MSDIGFELVTGAPFPSRRPTAEFAGANQGVVTPEVTFPGVITDLPDTAVPDVLRSWLASRIPGIDLDNATDERILAAVASLDGVAPEAETSAPTEITNGSELARDGLVPVPKWLAGMLDYEEVRAALRTVAENIGLIITPDTSDPLDVVADFTEGVEAQQPSRGQIVIPPRPSRQNYEQSEPAEPEVVGKVDGVVVSSLKDLFKGARSKFGGEGTNVETTPELSKKGLERRRRALQVSAAAVGVALSLLALRVEASVLGYGDNEAAHVTENLQPVKHTDSPWAPGSVTRWDRKIAEALQQRELIQGQPVVIHDTAIPEAFMLALSGGFSGAVGPNGNRGLFQLNDETARRIASRIDGVDPADIGKPRADIPIGVAYINSLLHRVINENPDFNQLDLRQQLELVANIYDPNDVNHNLAKWIPYMALEWRGDSQGQSLHYGLWQQEPGVTQLLSGAQ